MLFYGSFRSTPLGVPGDFTLGHYIGAYTDPQTYQLLLNSFVFASGSAILSTVAGSHPGMDFDTHQCAVQKSFSS